MPPDAPTAGSPADWLRHARSDLALAQIPIVENVLVESLCFHAQQATEKSIKAILLHYGQPIPRTHDIALLVTLVAQASIPWDEELNDAAGLTDFAVEARYPRLSEGVPEDDYREAVGLAERVVAWAERLVVGSPE